MDARTERDILKIIGRIDTSCQRTDKRQIKLQRVGKCLLSESFMKSGGVVTDP
jgi:hypothetical protein